MRRFRKEFGLKKARILRERLIPVSQRLKIGINRHPHSYFIAKSRSLWYHPCMPPFSLSTIGKLYTKDRLEEIL